jgi:hypothetical protein
MSQLIIKSVGKERVGIMNFIKGGILVITIIRVEKE